jgi:hypothetical protein
MHLHLAYCGDESSSLPTLFHCRNKELVVLVASPTLKNLTQIRKVLEVRRETTIHSLGIGCAHLKTKYKFLNSKYVSSAIA